MAKSLNDVLKGVNKSKVVPGSTGDDPGVDYAGKMKDERDFVAQHKVEKHEDRVGNGDEVYNASKVKKAKMERHGHDPDPKARTVYKQSNEEVKIEEAKKCNMTEAGTMCEVHGMKSCDDKKEEKSASDKEPRYNGEKKSGRQLITDKKKIEEREMTAAEKKKEEKLKGKYDDSSMKANMQKQYGAEKGKQVYFAYIRKKAMKSEQADTHISTPSTTPGDTGRV